MPLWKGNPLLCSSAPLSLMALLPLKGALAVSTENHTDPGTRGQDTPFQLPSQLRSHWLRIPGRESSLGSEMVDQSLGEQSGGAMTQLLPYSNQHK